MTGSRLVVGHGEPDRSLINLDMSAPFTPEQEARIREIMREEIVDDQVRRSGFEGEDAESLRRSLKGANPSEAPHAR